MASTDFSLPPRPIVVPSWRRPGKWLQALLGAVIGGGIVYAVLGAVEDLKAVDAFALTVAFVLVLWVQLVVHEAGHAVAGLFAGHRAIAFGVGPLRLERKVDRWRFLCASSVDGVAGFALMLPKRGGVTSIQSSVFILGGPIANLGLAALFAPLALPGALGDASLGSAIAGTVVGSGIVIGVVNLIPIMVGGWSSDGRQLLKLWQGSDESKALAFLSQLSGLSLAGVRPRDWPMEELDHLDLSTMPLGVSDSLARCRLAKAIDQRRFGDAATAGAAAMLAQGFWRSPDGLRQVSALLIARWVLETQGDTKMAEAWLQESKGGLLDQTASQATIAARISLKRGEREKARIHLREAEVNRSCVYDAAGLEILDEEIAEISEQLGGA